MTTAMLVAWGPAKGYPAHIVAPMGMATDCGKDLFPTSDDWRWHIVRLPRSYRLCEQCEAKRDR